MKDTLLLIPTSPLALNTPVSSFLPLAEAALGVLFHVFRRCDTIQNEHCCQVPSARKAACENTAVGAVLYLIHWLWHCVTPGSSPRTKASVTAQLKTLTKEDLQKCFRKSQGRGNKCNQSERECSEGDSWRYVFTAISF